MPRINRLNETRSWSGVWIRDAGRHSNWKTPVRPSPYFRKEFEWNGGKEAKVFISGLGDVGTTIELYDALGTMVMRKEVVDGKITLDSNLKAGVYLMKAVLESGRVSCLKLIVQSQR